MPHGASKEVGLYVAIGRILLFPPWRSVMAAKVPFTTHTHPAVIDFSPHS